MKFREIYQDDEYLTDFGRNMDASIAKTLKCFFNMGASPHDVASLLHSAVEDLRCETTLGMRAEESKEKRR